MQRLATFATVALAAYGLSLEDHVDVSLLLETVVARLVEEDSYVPSECTVKPKKIFAPKNKKISAEDALATSLVLTTQPLRL